MTYVTQVDMAGSIPQMLQNSVAKNQSEKCHLLAQGFVKRFGK